MFNGDLITFEKFEETFRRSKTKKATEWPEHLIIYKYESMLFSIM